MSKWDSIMLYSKILLWLCGCTGRHVTVAHRVHPWETGAHILIIHTCATQRTSKPLQKKSVRTNHISLKIHTKIGFNLREVQTKITCINPSSPSVTALHDSQYHPVQSLISMWAFTPACGSLKNVEESSL